MKKLKKKVMVYVIKINLNQLNEYYMINKVKVTMIVTGFIVLIIGIMLWLMGR